MWFLFSCCTSPRPKKIPLSGIDPPPYADYFNFYSEQMHNAAPRLRRVESFESLSSSIASSDVSSQYGQDGGPPENSAANGATNRGYPDCPDNIEGLDDPEGLETNEMSELLSSSHACSQKRSEQRASRDQPSSWFSSWWWPWSRRSYDCKSSLQMSRSLSKPSRTSSLISTDSLAGLVSPLPPRSSRALPADRAYEYDDLGLEDAQIVPDAFVVSVPLKSTNH
ncbi:uncharacterized protein V1516DRAFT_686336 [Lipomyces oligophaga]|uniref:uncharacterized protein n=1 Tax=Lipomyces oligophaga TaxID=45792 RepID=UPI0034CE7C8F